MNLENFNRVLAHIEACPETWDQSAAHRGSTASFAGRAQLMSGESAHVATAHRDARMWLDISAADADWLFAQHRTLDDFRAFGASAGYDESGYDREGYDREGYDREGYDREGYDLEGYDREGYDCAGYDFDGYDRDGYDFDGYDRDGLDANNEPHPE